MKKERQGKYPRYYVTLSGVEALKEKFGIEIKIKIKNIKEIKP